MLRRYREVEISTSSPEGLVVKMYEGAIRFSRVARVHHEEGRIADRGVAISRALAIVDELHNALDVEHGGEIAANLQSLYGFISGRLLEANLKNRPEALDEAVSILSELHGAWVEIARNPAEARAAGGER